MLPLIPTLALAFFSFVCSAFVILRIVIPILPPHPLSRRVPPSEFGLPNFRSLSPADKSHIWLAACDILALAVFIWQAIMENTGSPSGFNVVEDPLSAVRLWIAMTLRQSCLLIVAVLTLAHVRMGHPVSFGAKHWMLWAPTLLFAVVSTSLAGVLAGAGVDSFFWGLVGYSASIAILSSIAFGCLIGTLIIIKRNLAAFNDIRDPWPPALADSEKPRPSFATDDVDALKDGSSWITSRASSRHDSVSAWSFTTHRTQHSRMPSNASSRLNINPAIASHSSIPPKSSFWFNPATGRESPVPPVPPLPAPYRPSSPTGFNAHEDPDPFRRNDPRPRMGSQSSWLTEPSTYQPTLSAWSFPATHAGSIANYPYPSTPDLPNAELLTTDMLPSTAVNPSRSHTPAMAGTDVLGGYGYSTEGAKAEKGAITVLQASAGEVDVSVYRAIGWLVTIWVPLALALPYYFTVHPHQPVSSVMSILLILSVTMSAPLLALNIVFRSPLPIPAGLFDTPEDPPSVVMRAPSPLSSAPSFVNSYKRSGSITVVEGRRSGDVWLTNGDAVEGKSKIGRAMGLLQPKPKLAVLPPGTTYEKGKDGEATPPLPIQDPEDGSTRPPSPQSMNNAELGLPDNKEMGMRKKDSKASSHWSTTDESMGFAAQVMVAQKHYSTLAMTMVLPSSPTSRASLDMAVTTGADPVQNDGAKPGGSNHLRTRSSSSIVSGPRSAISPPPASPLPPTPPTLKNFRAKLAHRRSYSSINEFSFGPIENDNTNEIDALSAGMLPLLIPGMKIGGDMKITGEWKASPSFSWGGDVGLDGMFRRSRVPSELGGTSDEISSPQFHSTPHIRKGNAQGRTKKTSTHKRHHFSLPSLSLGKDGMHAFAAWSQDVNRAFDSKTIARYSAIPDIAVTEENRPNTVYEAYSNSAQTHLNAVREEDEASRPSSPARYSTGFPDSALDVPHSVNSARNSMATLISALDQELKMPLPPPSAASEVTLFDFNPSTDGLGESTPYDAQKIRRSTEEQAPPVPQITNKKAKASRRSSIVYIKSNENVPPIIHPEPSPSASATVSKTSPTTGFGEWTRLIPKKASKLQMRASKLANQENEAAELQRAGLRPLSLLQDRSTNLARVETRPLVLGKKNKQKATVPSDENAPVKRESSFKKSLRPFKLARNETTKQRAALREQEVLPDVVVRPPSDGHQLSHAFNFR